MRTKFSSVKVVSVSTEEAFAVRAGAVSSTSVPGSKPAVTMTGISTRSRQPPGTSP